MGNEMDPLDWDDFINYGFIDQNASFDFSWPDQRTDKPAIIDDAIEVLKQLRAEAQELKKTNEKLQGEIQSLKSEKTELREEKLILKADKEKIGQQLKAKAIPTAEFVPTHPAGYHTGLNKMAVYPSYGLIPMWQYLPPSSCDSSHDHELRPPAA